MPTPILDRMIAGMTPTAQQANIVETAKRVQAQQGLRVLAIAAGAGTGKTATLRMLEQTLKGQGQYTAFNTSLVNESKAKFKKAAANTTHSLAFRAIGKEYAHRLNGPRIKSDRVGEMLNLQSMVVEFTDSNGEDQRRTLDAGLLAGQVMMAIRRFCQSDARELTEKHFGYIDGIDSVRIDDEGRSHRTYSNNDRVKAYLLPFAQKAWLDIQNKQGSLPFAHDFYVKIWELNKPYIAADYILLDEAQDTAPVMLSILKQQTHAMLIFVGDSNQAIYEWRGAVDAMKAFPDSERRMLSQSFRFGQAIADVANSVLATLEEPTDLVMRGLKSIDSRIDELSDPDCVLCRTNATAVKTVLQAISDEKRPHLIGGGSEVVEFVKAARDLQNERPTRHPELCCFLNWKEVVKYSKTDEGEDLQLMVRLIEQFTCDKIIDALEHMPEEKDADIIVSTAHKSKGREWNTVKLANDFPTANRMSDADRRLLYVACTRAKLVLDISTCPPFTVRKDPRTGEPINVIEVTYTEADDIEEVLITDTTDEISLAEDFGSFSVQEPLNGKPITQVEFTPEGLAQLEESVITEGGLAAASALQLIAEIRRLQSQKPIVTQKDDNSFSWCKVEGNWTACGTPNMSGEKVRVYRKNGSYSEELLGEPVKKYSDSWCYETVEE